MSKKLFPDVAFATSELAELAAKINEPVIQKYLKMMATKQIHDILHTVPVANESAESYLRRQAVVQGQLAALETLLSIDPPATQA